LYDLLRARFQLDGTHRLLDLGCGTGTIALALSKDFEEVVGLDPEPELIQEAESIAAKGGARNVRFLVGGSEDLGELGAGLGTFRLVIIGNAFHWMDRAATLRILHDIAESGGGVAVLGGETLGTEPAGTEGVIRATIAKWLGDARRAGSGTYEPPKERHEAVISRSAFLGMEQHSVDVEHRRTIDDFVGFLYSTSYCSPYVLGTKREAFERDLREALGRLSPGSSFTQNERFGAILAWKR
jgi:ubiquinone/menaquinone biosynthesis C-methylase UbiE